MSHEQDVIDKARIKMGDDEFKFIISSASAMHNVIEGDISACWANWVEAARCQPNAEGRTLSPYIALVTFLIVKAVATLPEEFRLEGREKFEEMCGCLFDLQIEAMTEAARH